MISADRRWIFVHIQKTGGDAVRTALGAELNDPHKHFLASELREVYGRLAWQQCFKFAFVRNPWERLVSWWSMIDGAREQDHSTPLNKFQSYVLQRASTFQEFITNCTDEIIDFDGPKYIFRNQIDYLVDENGEVIVDLIGRFENFQQNFDEVTKRLGRKNARLPQVNSSRHGVYMDYYTPAMAEVVGRHYARDLKTFGYRFGE